MDTTSVIVGLGAGCVLGIALQRWVFPRAGLRARAPAAARVAPAKAPTNYRGWLTYYKEPPRERWPGTVPALAEIGRPRVGGAGTPSGEALGGF